MAYYQNRYGQIYTGDRQTRDDGAWDEEILDRPSPEHVWNGEAWVLPVSLPDWQGLKGALRGSDLLIRAISTSRQNDWALLLNCLDSNEPADSPGRMADFEYAIAAIRFGLEEDFTAEQLGRFNELLEQYEFPFRVS